MKLLCVLAFIAATAVAQTSDSQLEIIGRKLDAQSAKLDQLSQRIGQLEQAVTGAKASHSPEATPSEPPVASAAPVTAGTTTHVVERGETLTSIAKAFHVTIDELQKQNRITDDRKLQIGQTLTIPPSASGTAGANTATSPTPSPSVTP